MGSISYFIKFKKILSIIAFIESVNTEPKSGKSKNALTDMPYFFVILSILANPTGVAPKPAPIKPAVNTAES